jgi:hypothetical protein
MSKGMMDIVRASSPANEYVRTNRSPPSSFLFVDRDNLDAAAALSLAEPAAGAFATPHNSGKFLRGNATLPSPLDASGVPYSAVNDSGSGRIICKLTDDEEVVEDDQVHRDISREGSGISRISASFRIYFVI